MDLKFGLILVVLTLIACSKNELIELPEGVDASVTRAENVEYLYSDSAKLKIKIAGPVMLSRETNNLEQEEFPAGVIVDFYDLDEEPSSRLTAKYGTRYRRLGKVVVRDSVVWRSVENETIETEELIWNERTKKIFTKKFARISRPDEIIYGYGFEANQDFSNAQIRAVTGRVKVQNIQ